MQKLYIRTDMNQTIATGHVMRCLSIADAGRTVGVESVFILADNEAVPLLESKGYSYIALNSKWDDLESEIEVLQDVIRREKIERLLIDSYQVTEKYLRALTEVTYTIYLDDLNAFTYPVNALICYANYWQKFNYANCYEEAQKNGKIDVVPEFYVGCKYAPLRQEFMNLPEKQISEKIERVLLMSGGADTNHSIVYLLNKLKTVNFAHVDVICGRFYEEIEELREEYEAYKNIHIHSNVSNLIAYMKQADLAISAGGSTLYELCAVGTPAISFSYVDNQMDNVRQFEKEGIMECMGDFRNKENLRDVYEMVTTLKDKEVRKELSAKMRQMVDGKGALNIVKAICD